jgi:Flp pilus assembly protein TadB
MPALRRMVAQPHPLEAQIREKKTRRKPGLGHDSPEKHMNLLWVLIILLIIIALVGVPVVHSAWTLLLLILVIVLVVVALRDRGV